MPITTAIGNNVSAARGGEGEACIAGDERKRREEKVYARVERQLGCCCWLLLLLLTATTGWKDGSGNKVVVELSVNSRGRGRERKGGRGRGREKEKGRGQAEIVRAELGTKGTAYLAGIAFSPRWINAGPPSSSTSSSSFFSFSSSFSSSFFRRRRGRGRHRRRGRLRRRRDRRRGHPPRPRPRRPRRGDRDRRRRSGSSDRRDRPRRDRRRRRCRRLTPRTSVERWRAFSPLSLPLRRGRSSSREAARRGWGPKREAGRRWRGSVCRATGRSVARSLVSRSVRALRSTRLHRVSVLLALRIAHAS